MRMLRKSMLLLELVSYDFKLTRNWGDSNKRGKGGVFLRIRIFLSALYSLRIEILGW
jgi:hypothetical protein